MELKTGLQRRRIADRHRHAVDLGMDSKVVRRIGRAQGMIAADVHWSLQPAERSLAVVGYDDGLAMHRLGRPSNLAAGLLNDGLVAEADTKQRRLAFRQTDQLEAAAGIVRRAGPRREDDQRIFL